MIMFPTQVLIFQGHAFILGDWRALIEMVVGKRLLEKKMYV